MDATLQKYIDKLNALNFKKMYEGDFFLTWEKSDDELEAVFTVADALRYMRENNISTKIFESGLGISLFRDNSTRTRFSFASACNLLGLEVQDLDEGKSQIAHGETVRETANMISFMADVIGIRDDMYIGKGHTYQKEVAEAVTQGHKDGVLEQKPTLVNLQCDIDHPTQCMADMLHIIHHFGGVENLKGKKIAMTWAYSPSYGKPLSVPQGVIGLMSRFGMDVVLAHPEGYEVMPEVEEVAKANAAKTGDPKAYRLPVPHVEGKYNVSFSGLKTAVLNEVNQAQMKGADINVPDLAASFQERIAGILAEKLLLAAADTGAKQVCLAGGVAVLLTGYLPVGAVLIAALAVPVGWLQYGTEAGAVLALNAVIMVTRHWAGLQRIHRGEELQFFRPKL